MNWTAEQQAAIEAKAQVIGYSEEQQKAIVAGTLTYPKRYRNAHGRYRVDGMPAHGWHLVWK